MTVPTGVNRANEQRCNSELVFFVHSELVFSFIIKGVVDKNSALTTKMNELHAAISFSNHGVHCLEANNVSLAMQAFQNSMQALKQVTQTLPARSSIDDSNELPPSVLAVKATMCPVYFGERVEGLQNALYYTFDRAMLLRSPLPQMDDDEIDSYVFFTAMIVSFNLALTTHVSALKHGKSLSLQHAIKLYTLAGKLANEINVFQNLGDMMKWLTMNNIANIHVELCDYENFAVAFWLLQKACNDDANIDGCTIRLFKSEELNELMLNFFYYHVPNAAHAA